ncbi:MAG: hypothetical protein KAG34_07895 [Cocleimonas sp.]|nr:hypothetical protein [Cocleimonas sp.]
MCRNEIWEKSIKYSDIANDAIVALENIIEDKLIDRVIVEVLKNDDYSISKMKSNEEKINEFKSSIIDCHLKWIMEDLYINEQSNFNDCNQYSLKDQNYAYCLFYKKIKECTDSINQHKDVKIALIEYFDSFEKMYCS